MMKNGLKAGVVTLALAATSSGSVFGAEGDKHAPYAGQQSRVIKSLSAADIEALRQGRGWGFAKPAELNGYPGPLHVLELRDALGLNAAQRARIEAIYGDMKAAAQRVGRDFLAAEQALDAAFAGGNATADKVEALTVAAARLRAKLQSVHLRAHLLTTPLLSPAQRHRYAVLRGYAGSGHGSRHQKGSHKGHH